MTASDYSIEVVENGYVVRAYRMTTDRYNIWVFENSVEMGKFLACECAAKLDERNKKR